MSLFSIIFLYIILLIVPIALLSSLWKGSCYSRFDWIIQVLFTGMFLIWIYFSGSWDWLGYYFRYLWLGLFLLILYPSWKRAKSQFYHDRLKKGLRFSRIINITLLLIFSLYNLFVISSFTTDDQAIELSFPLQEGTYYIGQGGNHPHMNYHNAYPDQKYALDIVKLNSIGTRAFGIYPKELEKYAIFADHIYSPCHGEVIAVEQHLPDQIPPATDRDHITGNYVALLCDHHEAILYLAHMKENSILVNKGDKVETGQVIGAVGNSGNTTEPHLHIHAEINGKGVPITFDDKFLVRNQLIKTNSLN